MGCPWNQVPVLGCFLLLLLGPLPSTASDSFTRHKIVGNHTAGASHIAAVDFDGDGDTDVVTAAEDADEFAWHEYEDGTFTRRPIRIGPRADGARHIVPVDFDGDGDLDVVTAAEGADEFAWYENPGNHRRFVRHAVESGSRHADGATAIAPVDFDGDGDTDLVTAAFASHEFAWYENEGNDTDFTRHVIHSGQHARDAEAIVPVDFDGDGDLDVVTAAEGADEFAWYENRGNHRRFVRHTVESGPRHADGAATIVPVDFDGDGDTDLVTAAANSHEFAWYENDGTDRGFWRHPVDTGSRALGARDIKPCDVDGDGDFDLVTGAEGTDELAWYENEGNHLEFTRRVVASDSTHSQGVSEVACAYLDGDPHRDFAAAASRSNAFSWYSNDGMSRSFTRHEILAESGAEHARTIAPTDLNGDGDTDLVTAAEGAGEFAGFENRPSHLHFARYVIESGPSAAAAWMVVPVDFDGEGGDDLVTTARAGTNLAWLRNRRADRSFERHVIEPSGARIIQSIAPVDLDRDGDTDVVTASRFNDEFAWYENQGNDIDFTRRVIASGTTVRDPVHVAPVDFDRDGDIDVVTAAAGTHEFAWYENEGDDTDFTRRVIAAGSSTRKAAHVVPIDFDRDGDLDVVTAAEGADEFAWYENQGNDIDFTRRVIASGTTVRNPVHVAPVDFDRDGDIDVVTAAAGTHEFAWYENGGEDRSFVRHVIDSGVPHTGGALRIVPADLDGDGDLDVLTAAFDPGRFIWYERH